jgi:hypothetical protein
VQDLQRVLVACDVELVARSTLEGSTLVGADLRCDTERTQQAESAAGHGRVGDVEMDGDLPTPAEMDAAGRMQETGKLGEAIAFVLRCDRCQLVAEVLRE